jgi:ribosomal protein L16 Arg81 hydroxylase
LKNSFSDIQPVQQPNPLVQQPVQQPNPLVQQPDNEQFNNQFNSEIEYLRKQNEILQEQNKLLQDELKTEREHSRNITSKLVELTQNSQELTRNSQLLLKNEQDKNNSMLLPPDEQPDVSAEESGQNSKSLSLWQKLFKNKKK